MRSGPFSVDGDAGRRMMTSVVGGLAPGPARIRGDQVDCVEVRMAPTTAYSVLGVSLADLDGTVVDLADLFGADGPRLQERLAAAPSWNERFRIADAFLVQRRRADRTVDPEVAVSWSRIVAGRGQVRVDTLAAACGWSRKRLWARFRDQVGLTPKRAAMLVRFDRAAQLLAAGHHAAQVAADCGYADQSHLHRDVAAFAGRTPSAIAGDALSAFHDCAWRDDGTFVQDVGARLG